MGKYSKAAYNKVKAINERIADIAREYGRGSEAYRNFEKWINKTIPAELRGTSRTGNIRIKQGKKDIAALDKGKLKVIEKGTKTRGQYTSKLAIEYKREYGEGKPSKEQLKEFSNTKQHVKDAADSGLIKKILSGGTTQGKTSTKRSYAELNNLLEEYEKQEAKNEAENINNYLMDSGESNNFRRVTAEELKDIEKIFGDTF